MQQKLNWTHYLTLGISILALLIPFSCGKKTVELKIVKGEYVYINNMNTQITITPYEHTYKRSAVVKAGDSLILSTSGEGIIPFQGNSLVINIADSVIIRFDNGNCTTYNKRAYAPVSGLLSNTNYDNYANALVSERFYRYRYTIDSTDYKLSSLCK